jgi:hypothetical protein
MSLQSVIVNTRDKPFSITCCTSCLLVLLLLWLLKLIITCPLSHDSPHTPSEPTVEIGQVTAMSTKQSSYRNVLASFIEEIPDNKGWWYRLPSKTPPTKNGQPLPSDVILPHLGTPFGLTEVAMWVILFEIGFFRQKGDHYCIDNNGLEDFRNEFKVSDYIESSPSKIDGKRLHFVRMGFPNAKPTGIWNDYKKKMIKCPPTAISSRASLKMVTGDLVYILKDSSLFLVVLQSAGGYFEDNGIDSIARNSNSVERQSPADDDDEEEKNSDNNNEEQQLTATRTTEALQVNIQVGEVADPSLYPALNAFKIPTDNYQAMQTVHKELLQAMSSHPEHNQELPKGSI